jgi:hypothetical protein
MRNQHRGPLVVALRQCQAPDHRGTVAGVFDVFDHHHRSGSSSRRLSHGESL